MTRNRGAAPRWTWDDSLVRCSGFLNGHDWRPGARKTATSELSEETIPTGYVEAWGKLESLGIRVIALRDNPRPNFDVSACVELHGPQRCAMTRAAVLARYLPADALASLPDNVRLVDLSDYFCNQSICYPVVGNVLIYRKLHHVIATYARSSTPMLEREVRGALATDPKR